jgi:hypothetical protein
MSTPEDFGAQARALAIELGAWLDRKNPQTEVALAAMAMTLAMSARAYGLTPQQTLNRFASSVKVVYGATEGTTDANTHH